MDLLCEEGLDLCLLRLHLPLGLNVADARGNLAGKLGSKQKLHLVRTFLVLEE